MRITGLATRTPGPDVESTPTAVLAIAGTNQDGCVFPERSAAKLPVSSRTLAMQRTSDFLDCRLCHGRANLEFSREDGDGDLVSCYKCTNCGSLQTQDPVWLPEEYARSARKDFVNLDTYAAERSLRLRKFVYFIWLLAGFNGQKHKLLDWGGGVGLLVRLLRDIGIDAYLHDKYAHNHFASGFSAEEGERYSLVTAFEVLEHLPNPSTELTEMFSPSPTVLIASTALFNGQGPDWPYLGPPKSEHVFFYSEQALRSVGARFGYNVEIFAGDLIVFYKNDSISKARLRVASALLSRNYLSGILFAIIRHKSHCDADNQKIAAMLRANFKADHKP